MFQELPPIHFQSLSSMIGLPRSRTQSQSSGKSYEWKWSMVGEKHHCASLELGSTEDGLDDYTSGMRVMIIAKPPTVLTRGSVQEVIQGRAPHDQA